MSEDAEVPMAVKYGVPALQRTGFITECEHRYAPSAVDGHVRWCTKLSDTVNVSVGIDPVTCAHCRLKGSVDPDYIRLVALNLMSGYLTHAILGFTANEAEVVELLNRTYNILVQNGQDAVEVDRLGRFKNTILELVSNGRITEETAVTFCTGKPLLEQ